MDEFHEFSDWSPTETERRMFATFDEVFDATEPVPAHLVQAAQDCYTWRTVDAELLELLVDSAETELALVRDDDRMQRFMAFGNDERGVHFECVPDAGGRLFELSGIVVPAGTFVVRVDRPGADIEVTSDDLGSFVVGPLDAGSIRLTIRTDDGDDMMVTPWFMLQ